MKKGIIYLLVALVSFVYHYETLKYMTRVVGQYSCSHMDDFDCGEEGSGSEEQESKEEARKLSPADYQFTANTFIIPGSEQQALHHRASDSFFSSGYSQVVDSPPELL